MPSDQDFTAEAEEWKKKGNEAFGKSDMDTAIQAYSQGLVQVDRVVATPFLLKTTLLSNRAACYLKEGKVEECKDDCDSALKLLEKENDTKLRGKLLYRRAKALFLRANMPHRKQEEDLQLAAKDLLSLISFDATNKEATQLLNTIRAQHALETKNTAKTPLAKTLEAAMKKDDKVVHNLKVLIGMLSNDTALSSMELGRLFGVFKLLELAADEDLEVKARHLALQCLSCAGSHPPFCRKFMTEAEIQSKLSEIMIKTSGDPKTFDVLIGCLTSYLRLILHLDRDDPDKDIDGSTLLNYDAIIPGLVEALHTEDIAVVRVVIDVISSWLAGKDLVNVIRASLDNYVDPTLPVEKSKFEMHLMTPRDMSRYKQRMYQIKKRNMKWAQERSEAFCKAGGLDVLVECALGCEDINFRREITIILAKIITVLDIEDEDTEEDKRRDAVKKYFFVPPPKKQKEDEKKEEERLGPVIEEVTDEDEDEEGKVVDVSEEEKEEVEAEGEKDISPQLMMQRAELATALLMVEPEIGGWSIGRGWPGCEAHLIRCARSGNKLAQCLVSELLAAAASVKTSRPTVAHWISTTDMKLLIQHPDRDVRTAAASAIAKLGLGEQQTEDIDIVSLLEAACFMLEDDGSNDPKRAEKLQNINIPSAKTGATTSVERGIEVMAYLSSRTVVKEELAHGFQATPDSPHTGLELMVKAADMPSAGEALFAFGLASSFQLMAVTPLTLRKEAFEGKEMTMEQYDEIQKMQKTEEQKELENDEPELQEDSDDQCTKRIQLMGKANVPRALVQLTEGASDQTLEQAILALNRMANEPSVRGTMIQQGVLSRMIKIEKEEQAPSELRKKIVRMIRHCMAKMLVTTNPGLLTSAQKMGSIKPLIQLVRDVNSNDYQKFEALLSLTNLAASGDDTKNKIAADKGIPALKYAMFAENEMVKKAATECLCNMVPNEKFMATLKEVDELRLWLALADDFEENYECARAAAGCLAMATADPEVANTLVSIKNFKERMDSILGSGSLELMHRILVVVQNLTEHGGKLREKAVEHGLVVFAEAYADSYHDGSKAAELDLPDHDMAIMRSTVEVAKQIVRNCQGSISQ